ncbi:MAG: ATP-binding cassette domain-containing protein [Elusimicrobiota bacterium]|nr:ATP-binding cassette domain-containing protein [Elusimicrobiota bacterium]
MIKIRNLKKRYQDKIILNGINADISEGEIFSIMGPSGSGKSTFIKCLVKLVVPDSGQVIVDGKDVLDRKNEFELAHMRQDFGYLFQDGALFDSLDVMENVCFGLKYLTDINPSKYKKIANEKLELVGLKDVESLRVSELSGGMKKRVSLARAIAAEPKYILYDEPTTGLDPVSSEMISELILSMQKKLDITSIVVTHDLKLAFTISDRIAMLHDGKFDLPESPGSFKKSEDPFVKKFIEDSICREMKDSGYSDK